MRYSSFHRNLLCKELLFSYPLDFDDMWVYNGNVLLNFNYMTIRDNIRVYSVISVIITALLGIILGGGYLILRFLCFMKGYSC